MKIQKNKMLGGGGQGECERRSFCENSKYFFLGGGNGSDLGGQGGCERRSDVFCDFFFFFWGGGSLIRCLGGGGGEGKVARLGVGG